MQRVTETIAVRFAPGDAKLLRKVANLRKEDLSVLVRRGVMLELARLGFLSQKQMKALGFNGGCP